MYRLYGKPFTMSMVPEGTLDEIGVPFETVTLPDGRSTDPAYLELRPDGLVPTFVDGDLVVYEGSAIAMHLADRHKEAGLAPLPGSRERAWWYQWMVCLARWFTRRWPTSITLTGTRRRLTASTACARQRNAMPITCGGRSMPAWPARHGWSGNVSRRPTSFFSSRPACTGTVMP